VVAVWRQDANTQLWCLLALVLYLRDRSPARRSRHLTLLRRHAAHHMIFASNAPAWSSGPLAPPAASTCASHPRASRFLKGPMPTHHHCTKTLAPQPRAEFAAACWPLDRKLLPTAHGLGPQAVADPPGPSEHEQTVRARAGWRL